MNERKDAIRDARTLGVPKMLFTRIGTRMVAPNIANMC